MTIWLVTVGVLSACLGGGAVLCLFREEIMQFQDDDDDDEIGC